MNNRTTLKRLGDNFIALFTLQLINYLLPLLLIPFLIRVLGMDGFGIYSFVMAIILYGIKMSDYGFDLSATYHISLNREKKEKLNEIFSSVLIIKISIALSYLLFLTVMVLFFDKLALYKELFFASFGIVLGQVLIPLWFFQGMEKMRYVTVLNSLSKVLFIVSIFIFVEEKNDLVLLFILNSLSSLFVGIFSLYIAMKHFNLTLKKESISTLLYYLKDGWYIFTSKISVEFYTTVNVVILGLMVSPTLVGYYSIAEKIIYAIGGLLDPVTRTVYPYLVKVQQDSNENFILRNRQLSWFIFAVMLPVSLLVAFFSKDILVLITGEDAVALSITSLQVLSLALIVFLYGSQFTNILVTLKETKFLNRVLFQTAIINTLLAPILIYLFGIMGLVCLNVFVAFFIALKKGYFIFKKFKILEEES